MKLNREISCNNCTLPCDFYKSLSDNTNLSKEIPHIQASFKRHEIICKQNSSLTQLYFVLKGTVKLYLEGNNNKNVIFNIITHKSYLGLLSFFNQSTFPYSIMALEETQICMIDMDVVREMYLSSPELFLHLNSEISKSFEHILKKIVSLNRKQIRGRIAETILYLSSLYNSNHFSLILTRKELGEMAGISEENTVRILNELRNQKIIEITNREVSILNPRLLTKICECG